MSDTQAIETKAAVPRFMRTVPAPLLTPALEEAIPKWIADGPVALEGVREAAASALRLTGLPHSGSEDFSFVRTGEFLPHLGPPAAAALARLAGGLPSRSDIERQLVTEARESYLVLVDGVFVPELSKPGPDFQVARLDTVLPALSRETRDAFIEMVAGETDAAAAMAVLFAAEPVHIRVAANAAPASPLLILHFSSGSSHRTDAALFYQGDTLSESRILVRHAVMARAQEHPPEAGSKATGSMQNAHTLALLGEGASLKFMEAGPLQAQSFDSEADAAGPQAAVTAKAIHFGKLTVRLLRDSRLLAVSAHTGSRLTRNSFSVDLSGEGAEAEVNGATVLTGSRQSHNFVRIRHLVPRCVSRQQFKSVAADQSRSSVDGTIYVAPAAQQTNAYQLINNLMLSDEARADSKPRLMIHADDVKCSHGATAGKLDPAQQFYLESRGLPPSQARALMTVAFIAEVLEKSGKTGEGFRDGLDHALLDSLKNRLPAESANRPKGGLNG
ncbi:MAG: Fe-S cluster assembly protein SufD [Fibrobacteres bacterium]|nr:Fe-S cluster assembly protein SufD [Fibrobacterota bacterium]